MKALTIHQPYAHLIATGEKWVENRTWQTHYRGPIAIHAGQSKQWFTCPEDEALPRGCVVAVADLAACVNKEWGDLKIGHELNGVVSVWQFWDHRHSIGPWCWILANVRELPNPIPAKGKQGFWNWEPPDGVEI